MRRPRIAEWNERMRQVSRGSKEARVRHRVMLAVAVGLVVILGAEPVTLGSLSSWAANAATQTGIDESRAQNLDAAQAALGLGTPAGSVPVVAPAADADIPLQPLSLAADLPAEDEETIELSGGTTSLQNPGTGEPVSVDLGGMAVTVAPAAEGASPSAVTLRVANPVETEQAGVTGVLLKVTDASAVPAEGEQSVEVTLSYEPFAGIGGGDWASRLRAVWIPDCAAGADLSADCQPSPLESVQDAATQTLTLTVPVTSGTAAEGATAAPAMLGATLSSSSAGSGGSVAVTAGVAGPMGNWSATGLSPTSTWGTSGATGSFTWSYPMPVPHVPAGPAPDLSLSYSSAVSDGRVPSSNNQAGVIGEGFDLTTSFIERTYETCSKDEADGANNAGLSAPDLCWGKDNATLAFNGASSELIRESATSETWHPKQDDGTRVEHVASGGSAGEYWKVTTTDGTQYFFGREAQSNSAWTVPVYGNHAPDRCYTSEFADSQCAQVWRWNLDFVVDVSGNSASYFYATETNRYRPFYGDNPVEYISGGRLTRIEYGTHADDGVVQAPAKVELSYAPRCITDLSNPTSWCNQDQSDTNAFHWPDTPVDLLCDATAECTTNAPTFFNRNRLAKITTYAHDGSSYQPANSWTLAQSFVPQGDGIGLENATGIMLRLESLAHVAHGGTLADVSDLPLVDFDYVALKNRVDSPDDGADALNRHRVNSIRTESGGRISVAYATGCSASALPADPATNTELCFPVKWQQGNEPDPRTDYFHKYVVRTVVEGHTNREPGSQELLTGSLPLVTSYEYVGGAKWVKPTNPMIADEDKTHSEFRGVSKVITRVGEVGTDHTKTVTTYYRGAGDTLSAAPQAGLDPKADNHERYAGQVFSVARYNGEDTLLSESVTVLGDPVNVATSPYDAAFRSARVPSIAVHGYTYDASGALVHHTKSTTSINPYGQPSQVDDRGDASTATDNTCLTTTYAHESDSTLATKYLMVLPATTETVAKACDEPVVRPADVVSASKATYDATGRATKTEVLDPRDGDGYVVSATAKYDSRGRPVEAADAAGQVTTTAYTQSTGGLLASMTMTNPLGHTTTTKFNPILGTPVSATDANGRETTGTYDALGRLIKVVYPQHANAKFASVEYSYTVAATGLNAVITKTLSADGQRQHLSSVLYDATLRPFQTQQEGRGAGPDQGRMVTQTRYDSAGRVIEQTEPWHVTGAPSDSPEQQPADTVGHTTYEYDDAGRQTAQIFWVGTDSNPDNEKWRTLTVYDGATTLQVPPMGGIPTATTVDARGRTIELIQYPRDPDTDAAEVTLDMVRGLPSTKYTYDPAGQRVKMTDPQGNDFTYEYDWGGRQVAASDPDAGNTTMTYDPLGRVETRTNGNGQALGYTYDALGRTTSVRDGSPTGTVRASWTYDTTLKGVASSATRVVDGKSYVTRVDEWDTAYRPLKSTVELPDTGAFTNLGTRSFSTTYAYTADGQTTKVTYPAVTKTDGSKVLGQETVTTTYDATSSMPSWMGGGFGWGVYVAASRYAADGRPVLTDLGNTYGAVVSYQYDRGTQRLTGISLDRERINGTELGLAYDYDPAGNVTSMKDAPTNTVLTGAASQDNQCFDYDGLGHLQTAWTAGNGDCAQAPSVGAMGGAAPYWTNYTYDVLGNRTKQTTHAADGAAITTTYGHGDGAGPHAVTNATVAGVPITYAYDAAGNRTSVKVGDVTGRYTWDAEGELTTAGDTRNVYDADGNRLVRENGSGTTVYLGGQEILITPTGDVKATRYYQFAGQTIAVRTGRGLGSAVTSLINDPHGTPVAAVPNGGHPVTTPVQRLYTDPFGGTRGGSNASTIPGDTQFLGKTRDESTGLTLLGARYYDEMVGAFISVDPILDLADPQQWNAYAYANSNPVSRADPTGLRVTDKSSYGYDLPAQWGERVRMAGADAANQASVINAYKAARGLETDVVPDFEVVPCVNEGTCKVEPDFSNLGEVVHGGLTGLGLIPGIGEIFDGLDALLCLAENDLVCAGLSAASMFPIIGYGALAGKAARAAGDVASAANSGVRLSDDYASLATQHVTNSGDTVLGSFPGYIDKANANGASYFDVGSEWDNIVARGDDPWALNQHFLDDRIGAGDRMLLSVARQDIRPGSYLAREVGYLKDNGYQWVNQWALMPKG